MESFEIGKYIINNEIGRGSFSTVFKGYDKEEKRDIAIKKINECDINKKKFYKLANREIKIMCQLNNKNILKLYDIVTKDNQIYLILEYCKNGDLDIFLSKRQLKEFYVKKYMIQIANGLKCLSKKNIIHRDLKPQNILIDKNYNIKLSDFGFARCYEESNMMRTVCGTPLYMAPEIINCKEYDQKVDLWSLGVIFYEMLFGCKPYTAGNLNILINKINNQPVKIPNNVKISTECQDLILKLLVKDPKKRISWDDFFNHKWFESNTKVEIPTNNIIFKTTNNNLTEITISKEESVQENNDDFVIVDYMDNSTEYEEIPVLSSFTDYMQNLINMVIFK